MTNGELRLTAMMEEPAADGASKRPERAHSSRNEDCSDYGPAIMWLLMVVIVNAG